MFSDCGVITVLCGRVCVVCIWKCTDTMKAKGPIPTITTLLDLMQDHENLRTATVGADPKKAKKDHL